jgi:cytochrome c
VRAKAVVSGLLAALAVLALLPVAVADENGNGEVPEPVEICLSCHALKPGEPELEGPSLWGVVGRAVASLPDFAYSPALRAKGGVWTRARLDAWIANPQAVTPGTLMTLGGVKSADDRQVVLDYLETLRSTK